MLLLFMLEMKSSTVALQGSGKANTLSGRRRFEQIHDKHCHAFFKKMNSFQYCLPAAHWLLSAKALIKSSALAIHQDVQLWNGSCSLIQYNVMHHT